MAVAAAYSDRDGRTQHADVGAPNTHTDGGATHADGGATNANASARANGCATRHSGLCGSTGPDP